MLEGIAGKVAFVTGAGAGIGAEVCRSLAQYGAKVAVVDRDHGAAKIVADKLKALGGEAIAVRADVSKRAEVGAGVAATIEAFGALHFGVNNAGINTQRGALAEQAPDEWDRNLAVNLTGVFNCMHAEIPEILKAGGGAIVNTASICGLVAVAGTAAYSAAKHGVIGLTKAAALDYATLGIRINAVAPGYVDTPQFALRPESLRQEIASRHPIARVAKATEISDTILFLLSSRSSFTTGSVHVLDGGYTAR